MRTRINKIDHDKALDDCRKVLRKINVDFSNEQIRSSSRESELVFVRALIVAVLRNKNFTYPKIGYILNRDHATAMHLEKYGEYTASGHFRDKYNEAQYYLGKLGIKGQIEYHQSMIRELKEKLKKSRK